MCSHKQAMWLQYLEWREKQYDVRETVDVFGADDDVNPIVPGASFSPKTCYHTRGLFCPMRFTRGSKMTVGICQFCLWYPFKQQRTHSPPVAPRDGLADLR